VTTPSDAHPEGGLSHSGSERHEGVLPTGADEMPDIAEEKRQEISAEPSGTDSPRHSKYRNLGRQGAREGSKPQTSTDGSPDSRSTDAEGGLEPIVYQTTDSNLDSGLDEGNGAQLDG
jgi:hypothetical protein